MADQVLVVASTNNSCVVFNDPGYPYPPGFTETGGGAIMLVDGKRMYRECPSWDKVEDSQPCSLAPWNPTTPPSATVVLANFANRNPGCGGGSFPTFSYYTFDSYAVNGTYTVPYLGGSNGRCAWYLKIPAAIHYKKWNSDNTCSGAPDSTGTFDVDIIIDGDAIANYSLQVNGVITGGTYLQELYNTAPASVFNLGGDFNHGGINDARPTCGPWTFTSSSGDIPAETVTMSIP